MSREDIECIETILDLGCKAFKSIEASAIFFMHLDKSLNKDANGRVNFKSIAIAQRRMCVGRSFDGTNMPQLAKKFEVSVDTIKRDLELYRANQREKSAKRIKMPQMQD
jgi:Mor family transcriptional regulator